jgi:hypothetical protein
LYDTVPIQIDLYKDISEPLQFEVLAAVVMKSYILYLQCSMLKVNQRFGGTCRLHFQGRTMSQARNTHEEGSKKTPSYLAVPSSFLYKPEFSAVGLCLCVQRNLLMKSEI